jgi:3-hydroxybutyryl-CoA dehydrogenase
MSDKLRVGIIGAGLMGHGIAQVFAEKGHRVKVYDLSADAIAALADRIRANLKALGQNEAAVDLVSGHTNMAEAFADVDVVFENGPENLAIKQKLMQDVEAIVPEHAILCSNTSVIPITKVMANLKRPGNGVGTHWWNPPYLVPLVEVIRTENTSQETVDAVSKLLADSGKTPVTVNKDVPGFVGNRLQHALWREAMALVQNGVCDAETVDTVVKASFGRRLAVLGPLENADLVGTDLSLAIHETMLPDLDVTQGPLPYLKELVAQGKLGFKSGEGFRKWTPEQQAELRALVTRHLKSLNDQGI